MKTHPHLPTNPHQYPSALHTPRPHHSQNMLDVCVCSQCVNHTRPKMQPHNSHRELVGLGSPATAGSGQPQSRKSTAQLPQHLVTTNKVYNHEHMNWATQQSHHT